jgi:phage tail sheath protein FI
MSYKTPDVYVKEVSVFPPSVAEVETAIPAFIGYTEKAEFRGKPLAEQPTEVSSLVEFEERFGGAPPVTVKEIHLTDTNNVSKVETESPFYMYDSIRLYFTNGGGRCYIVSVGGYGDDIQLTPLKDGLAKIEKEDEPTILLFPDAALLGADDLASLQQAALKQAAELMDRFVICDVKETGDTTSQWKDDYKAFRNKIGINNLLYGAAYTPYLKANLPKTVTFGQVHDKIKKYNVSVQLGSLTDETEVQETIEDLEDMVADRTALQGALTPLKGTAKNLTDAYQAKLAAFKSATRDPSASEGDVRTAFRDLCAFCYAVLDGVFDDLTESDTPLKGEDADDLLANLKSSIGSEIDGVAETLNSYVHNASAVIGGSEVDQLYDGTYTWDSDEWGTDRFDTTAVTADNSIYTGDDNIARLRNAEPFISGLFQQISGAVSDVQAAMASLSRSKESLLAQQMPVYKNIIAAVGGDMTILPPSGAVAGVYCAVDNSRGVWKAPANVSLNSVVGVTERIDSKEQEDLNVDVNAGKSINAIRPFSGKGILVWGARTLAGNDNEWRYISVRRFFNMVEESVKKSTYWAVFEPNDANLWMKLKAMIENYLTLKWREGALAGAAPEEAFFVKVGLGVTMTPQDILEGRLIVDIGMAVVRPAEFIILRFMHKMQES